MIPTLKKEIDAFRKADREAIRNAPDSGQLADACPAYFDACRKRSEAAAILVQRFSTYTIYPVAQGGAA